MRFVRRGVQKLILAVSVVLMFFTLYVLNVEPENVDKVATM